MAIFSTRSSKKGEDQAPAKDVSIDSIDTLRTRARQRLIGAVVLVALGIITFTLLFDSQPRPIPVDIQITMPDKDKPDSTTTATISAPKAPAATAALQATAPASTAAPAAPAVPATPATPAVTAPAAASAAVQASASLSPKEEFVVPKAEKKPEVKPEVKPEPKVEAKPAAKPEAKPEVKPEVKPELKPELKPAPKPKANDEAAKAMAILEGKTPSSQSSPSTSTSTPKAESASADASAGRFVVQVGAFAENEKARDARLKVERAGLKTYVNVAETPNGKRIRVRAGPFATRAEAEKAAAKIKSLDLPAAILTL
jgi:DedD protein